MKLTKKNIKFKNKKNITRKNKEGGFMVSDNNPKFLLYKMKNHLNTYLHRFNYILLNPGDKPKNNKEIHDKISQLEIVLLGEYQSIYDELIKLYNFEKEYHQVFITQSEFRKPGRRGKPFFNSKKYKIGLKETSTKLKPYHINFVAIIFMSFITELELFLITNVTKGYNIIQSDKKIIINEKNCESFFYSQHPDVVNQHRVYKDYIMNNYENLIDIFSRKLDEIFNDFMYNLVLRYSEFTGEHVYDIYKKFVPINHKDCKHFETDPPKYIFDFIFVNWKNNLRNPAKRLYMTEINKILINHLRLFRGSDKYIAEATGFFSFIFLDYPGKNRDYFGSCITWSLVELYIMSRLHINASNMYLDTECKTKECPEGFWQYPYTTKWGKNHHFWSSTKHKSTPVTHWSTSYNLHGLGIVSTAHVLDTVTDRINVRENKYKLIRMLIYPNFDGYLNYINNCKSIDESVKDRIRGFIQNRVAMLEYFFDKYD